MGYRIVMIGAGNLAYQLAPALHQSGHQILQVYNRSEKSGQELAKKVSADYTNDLQKLDPDAEIILISVKDEVIAEIASNIQLNRQIVAHTAGTVPLSILKNTSLNYGVFYPLQTFNKSIPVDFINIPICIEGSGNESERILQDLASAISNHVYLVNSEQRKALHIAAVFASNFTNAMYSIAYDIARKNGIKPDILKALIKETARKLDSMEPIKAQTGPAKRNDAKVIETHINFLENNSEYRNLYKFISDFIIKKHNSDE